LDAAMRQLDELQRQYREVVAQALSDDADLTLRLAQELAPIDTGNLVDSAIAYPVEAEGDKLSVKIGFGGPSAPYAGIVHEKLSIHHPNPPRGAKFLSRAVDELAPKMPERMARAIEQLKSRVLG
jgi:bacteriophage HK97-gp10 putative tail-component